ncbi:hypothetical protein QE152_g3587 [Popillia japonica]|uniref:Uncharacterized protein n=1 Tax=Popillia japonica TaxID=7064 RepID=A0AAW1N2S8_POPJA
MRTLAPNKHSKGNKDGHVVGHFLNAPLCPNASRTGHGRELSQSRTVTDENRQEKGRRQKGRFPLSESKLDNDVRSKLDDDSTITNALRSTADRQR